MALIKRRFLDKSEEAKSEAEEPQKQLELDIQPQSFESPQVTEEGQSLKVENSENQEIPAQTTTEESSDTAESSEENQVSENETEHSEGEDEAAYLVKRMNNLFAKKAKGKNNVA